MKSVINLRVFNEKIAPLVLAGTLALSLSSCGSVDMSELSTKDLLAIESVADLTTLDELIENDKLKTNIVAEADQLERYMDIVDKVSKLDFEGVEELRPLSEEEKNAIPSLTDEEIEELIEQSKSKNKDLKSLEDKIIALKKLMYLKEYCNSWVKDYGREISIDFMMASVKASVANELGISIDDYHKIKIPALLHSSGDELPNYCIEYEGEIYRISSGDRELWDTINYIYRVQTADKINDGTRFATFRKALNYGKTTIAAGCKLNGDALVNQNDYSYIKDNFIPKK